MRLRLNLASRPYADLGPLLKRLRIAMGVLAFLSILFGVGIYAFHARAVEARAREHAVDLKIAAIQRERQGYQDLMAQPDNSLLLKQSSTLNALFDEKSFSWTLAMEDLETVLPGGVQVTTLEPARAKDGHIAVRLRVAGPRDRAVNLVANLEHSKRFLSPRIMGEAAEAPAGANGQQLEPVSATNRFSYELLADYNPAAPGETRPARRAISSASAAPTPAAAPRPVQPAVRIQNATQPLYPSALPAAPQQVPMRAPVPVPGISRPAPQRRMPIYRPQVPMPAPRRQQMVPPDQTGGWPMVNNQGAPAPQPTNPNGGPQ